jgi:hypothetical protein
MGTDVTPVESALPDGALIAKYRNAGAHTDCYVTEVTRPVRLEQYIEAFYVTPLFKVERFILTLVGKPSSDKGAHLLAQGKQNTFAAWRVEDRTSDQLLLCDVMERTRSWLMVAEQADRHATRLYFGSVVIPKSIDSNGKSSLGFIFNSLMGFHAHYSVALLQAARKRLLNGYPSSSA